MCKRIPALLLALFFLFALIPTPARAAEAADPKAAEFRNSDSEAPAEGVCWYVDAMKGGVLMASRPADPALSCAMGYDGEFLLKALTDYPVDQVLFWQGRLLVSVGAELRTLDPESGELLETRRFGAPVERFAVSGDGLYVLSGGSVLRIGAETETLVSGVTAFWLEEAERLCYMRNEKTICSLDLVTGAVTEEENRASDLEDIRWETGDELQGLSVSALRSKFPHGKYWNHMPKRGTGMTYNNQNGWTSQPCYKHNGYCGTYMQTCNGYAPNGAELSYQCWGFADKLGYDATGRDPQNLNQSYGWKKLWYSSSLNSLKAGDIVRFNKYGSSKYAHSIYVTSVSGDTVTYADCNYDGTCVIRWGQTISKSTLRSWFVFLLSAPSAASSGGGGGGGSTPTPTTPSYKLTVKAKLDGKTASSCSGWGSFDVKINGSSVKTGVSSFSGTYTSGATYEIKNVKPVAGVMFDQSGSSTLTGTLKANTEIVLEFDHYYLNSAGQQVKTMLTDLPLPDKWSYKPICWALEKGVAGGISETLFGPNESCTRAQVVTFLWIANGSPEPGLTEHPFEDLSSSAYYYKPVLWALEQGITAGSDETHFGPSEPCTRGQIVTFFWRLAGLPVPAVLAELEEGEEEPILFEDVPTTAYYYQPVLWALEQGITAGTGEGQFSPNQICTRAETLTFLYTAVQKQLWAR